MRTAIIILAGFILWAACIGAGKWVAASNSSAMTAATVVFIALWAIAATVNLWVGVTRAGYSLHEELPIFLAIFLLPTVVAAIARWKFL